ncbi:MAG TPA: prepilin-type N-terminal cleavage/methylation domain-containing protein [Candidatus Saccharimonadales bacterium]|nr:prepilin-type N-terminal cleavage/methylation domain-containing protein [Candidatus Saccharimonadales bacterium]
MIKKHYRNHQDGFSVVELLIALTVVSLIVVAGVFVYKKNSSQTYADSTNGMLVKLIYNGGACAPHSIDTYPNSLCKHPMDTIVDPLGYHNRECGSYVAWMEQSTGHYMPYHLANYVGAWPAAVPASWIVTKPEAGDAAIRPNIPGLKLPNGEEDPGHAMYIINPNYRHTGDLLIKEYNLNSTGKFSEAVVAPSFYFYGHHENLVYIRFPEATAS